MSRYLVGILFCIVLALAYPAFRGEATEELRHRKIRKRDIRQKQKGAMNFWFYTELEKAYGLGKYVVLLRLYPVVSGTVTVLHVSLGWIAPLTVFDLMMVTVTALYLSAIILAACISRNRRLFGQAFVLWGRKETKCTGTENPVLRKDGKYTEQYSSFFDLILAALPIVFPVMMGVFEKNGM